MSIWLSLTEVIQLTCGPLVRVRLSVIILTLNTRMCLDVLDTIGIITVSMLRPCTIRRTAGPFLVREPGDPFPRFRFLARHGVLATVMFVATRVQQVEAADDDYDLSMANFQQAEL